MFTQTGLVAEGAELALQGANTVDQLTLVAPLVRHAVTLLGELVTRDVVMTGTAFVAFDTGEALEAKTPPTVRLAMTSLFTALLTDTRPVFRVTTLHASLRTRLSAFWAPFSRFALHTFQINVFIAALTPAFSTRRIPFLVSSAFGMQF